MSSWQTTPINTDQVHPGPNTKSSSFETSTVRSDFVNLANHTRHIPADRYYFPKTTRTEITERQTMHFKVGYWAVILGLHFISSSGFIVDEDEGVPRAASFRDTRDTAEPISTRNLQHDRDLDRNYRNTDRDRYKESSVLTRR